MENNADPFLKDCDGRNALHKCIQNINKERLVSEGKNNKHLKTIKLLVEAEPILLEDVDKSNKTPYEYYPDIIEYLKLA